jgi:AcrR family transcriptional regulator
LNKEPSQTNKLQRRRGRPPGQSDTRKVILEAARRLFASLGYGQTSIRAVAAESGVDASLVMHYFSSKEGLFRAAIEWPPDVDDAVRLSLQGHIENTGERLIDTLCRVWEDQGAGHPLAVMLRNAVQHEEAARLLHEFLRDEMVGRPTLLNGRSDTELREGLIYSTIVGLFLSRYVIGVEAVASVPRETIVRAVGPTIQRYLTGDIDRQDNG